MHTGVKNFRAILFVGALSLFTPVIHAENGQTLFGVAAIVAASSALVVPRIMAQANVNITQTNAATSIALNNLAAQTNMYGIASSAETARFNTLATLRIASMNTQKELWQTAMTTSFKMWDNNQNYALSRERLLSDNYFRQQEFNLRQTLLNAQLELDRTKFQMTLTEQGLSPGFKLVNSALQIQNANDLSSRGVVPYSSLRQPLTSLSSGNNSPRFFGASRGSAMARAFRGVAGVANGSSAQRKFKQGDIARFMASSNGNTVSSNEATPHVPRDSGQDESRHEGSYRAMR